MIVVNLFGAPNAGKSTGAAWLFSQLKLRGINAELVQEYAKDKVWEENFTALKNQAYVFGKQYYRISRLIGKVDVVITDAPLLLSCYYNNDSLLGENFNTVVKQVFNSFDSLNYMLIRNKPYNPKGRYQTEEEADAMAEPINKVLDKYDIIYKTMTGDVSSYQSILDDILAKLAEQK